MFDHVGAGTGRNDNISLCFFENSDGMLYDRAGLCPQACVECWLSAAGLIARKFHGNAETVENANDGFPCLRVERIDEASDEKLHSRHESIVIRFRFQTPKLDS